MRNGKKFVRSLGYAIQGLAYAFRTQAHVVFHVAMAGFVGLLGGMVSLDREEWLWVLLAIALVWMAELINTAIEVLVDLVSPEWNEKAGRVKDLAAAFVLVSAVFAILVGLFIFIPKFIGNVA